MADRDRPGAARPPSILVASKLRVGKVAAGYHREFHGRFMQVAGELGFDAKGRRSCSGGRSRRSPRRRASAPERLTKREFDTGRDELIDCDPPAAP